VTAGPSTDTRPEAVPTGNTFDKYGSTNPVVRRLMAGFHTDLEQLLGLTEPQSILDIGCGEGVLTQQWAQQRPGCRIVGLDLEDEKLQVEWAQRTDPDNLSFMTGSADRLPFSDGEFDLVTATEVLEHVPDGGAALAEMGRVGARWIIASVPREPIWRVTNVARGAYWRQMGNTPGHVNHWSKRGFRDLLARHGEVVELRSPFPWTMALVRLA
jgi:ubiquinone/menaquinone biosynthesis C-methylase UbiE